MEVEKYIQDIRSEYEETEPSLNMKLYGWEQISSKLGGREKPLVTLFYRFAYVGVAVLVLSLISLGVYSTAKAALPGEPLYPVKLFSEDLINSVNGDNQATIDNRAEEIVDLIKEDKESDEDLQNVIREYSQNVNEAEERDEEFEMKLEGQHKRFEKTAEESPEHEELLREAITASQTHEDEGGDNENNSPEVKGSKNSRGSSKDSSEED